MNVWLKKSATPSLLKLKVFNRINKMLRGLKALFTSGLIVNPMVLIGIFGGIVFSSEFETEIIFSIFSDYNYYLVALAIAFAYVVFFQKVYIGYGSQVDWAATAKKLPGAFAKLVLANILSVVFFVTLFF